MKTLPLRHILKTGRGLIGAGWVAAFVPPMSNGPLFASETIPKPFPVERYEALWTRSPFALSSVSEQAAATGFGEHLALVGYARIGSTDLVTIVDKQSQKRLLVTMQPGPENIRLVSLETNQDRTRVTAVLQKGEEKAVVKFDLDLLKSAPSPGAPIATAAGNSAPPPPSIRRPPRMIIPAAPGGQTSPATQ